MGELNFNPKVRGAKRPNEFRISTPEDAERLLASVTITRRVILSKVAEFYDPLGIFEPLKLQLKLALSDLDGLGWDEEVSPEIAQEWKRRFVDFIPVSYTHLTLPTILRV